MKRIKFLMLLLFAFIWIIGYSNVVAGSVQSVAYTTKKSCEDAIVKNKKLYPQYTRSGCYTENGYYYYNICDNWTSCKIKSIWTGSNNDDVFGQCKVDLKKYNKINSKVDLVLSKFLSKISRKFVSYPKVEQGLIYWFYDYLLWKLKDNVKYKNNIVIQQVIWYLQDNFRCVVSKYMWNNSYDVELFLDNVFGGKKVDNNRQSALKSFIMFMHEKWTKRDTLYRYIKYYKLIDSGDRSYMIKIINTIYNNTNDSVVNWICAIKEFSNQKWDDIIYKIAFVKTNSHNVINWNVTIKNNLVKKYNVKVWNRYKCQEKINYACPSCLYNKIHPCLLSCIRVSSFNIPEQNLKSPYTYPVWPTSARVLAENCKISKIVPTNSNHSLVSLFWYCESSYSKSSQRSKEKFIINVEANLIKKYKVKVWNIYRYTESTVNDILGVNKFNKAIDLEHPLPPKPVIMWWKCLYEPLIAKVIGMKKEWDHYVVSYINMTEKEARASKTLPISKGQFKIKTMNVKLTDIKKYHLNIKVWYYFDTRWRRETKWTCAPIIWDTIPRFGRPKIYMNHSGLMWATSYTHYMCTVKSIGKLSNIKLNSSARKLLKWNAWNLLKVSFHNPWDAKSVYEHIILKTYSDEFLKSNNIKIWSTFECDVATAPLHPLYGYKVYIPKPKLLDSWIYAPGIRRIR